MKKNRPIISAMPIRTTFFLTMLIMFVLSVFGSISTYAGAWKYDEKKRGTWYQEDDGTHPVNTWKEIDNNWHHFDNEGYVSIGWFQDNGDWYYGNNYAGALATDMWIYGKFYVGSDGKLYRNTTTPDGELVDKDGKSNKPLVGGKWYLGKDADLTGIYEFGKDSKPLNMDRSRDNNWWYSYYNGGTGNSYASAWLWIDEDKNGNKDGILNRYYFNDGWLETNTIIDGKQVNEDGAWVVDNVVQTISQRRDVEGNTVWRGLTPGIYWDKKHNSRIEVSTDWVLRYYENSGSIPYMEAEVLYGDADERFPEMIYPLLVWNDPIMSKSMGISRALSIFVGSKNDSDRGRAPGDIYITNGYSYGIFSKEDNKTRDKYYYYEKNK